MRDAHADETSNRGHDMAHATSTEEADIAASTAPVVYRLRVVTDDDADWSWLDQGEDRDALYALGAILERHCPCCGAWSDAGSLWGISFSRNTPQDAPSPGTCALDELSGYLREIAADLVSEDQG